MPTERDAAYREAEKKIEEARRSGATELDLSGEYGDQKPKLTELPESLGQLKQLQSLNLSRNQLTALPESLGQLTQLQSLNLSRNQLTALPEWLGQLTQLQSLSLSGNPLTALPEWLGQLTQLQSLDLSGNRLTALPEWLGQLTQLQSLDLSGNRLTALPKWLGQLTQLQALNLSGNQLTALPKWLGQLTQLQTLDLSGNQLTALPESLGQLTQVNLLDLGENKFTTLPDVLTRIPKIRSLRCSKNPFEKLHDWIGRVRGVEVLQMSWLGLTSLPESLGELHDLKQLTVIGNRLIDLPLSLAQLEKLKDLNLNDNPLNPELAAASEQGLDAVKRYLRAKAAAQVVLNEAKLILIGEGEVGKSCLLGALRGDEWVEGRDTTHGIEIKPVKVTDPGSGTEITMNGWDFGGQRVYRPTHQLFFSAPAVYLVVWKPREGPQQGFVKEWIKLVKHREPDAKILVVATHGGPGARQPDIDRQELWDLFGKDRVIDFFFVDSKPRENGECPGIVELRAAIAAVAASLPEMGRTVPKRWQEAREALKENGAPYLPLDEVLALCEGLKMEAEEARLFVTISHTLGHLIHYEHDPALRDIVVLKPDWLATAMSFVLDDKQTRDAHGLVSFARLSELWNDPKRDAGDRYEEKLHALFLRLMERYDLCYKVAEPSEAEDAISFWQRIKAAFLKKEDASLIRYTSLIAQLVPDIRPPEDEIARGWPATAADGDEQRVQICRVVEDRSGQSASAEGLFFQLIVRLHKYTLGRVNFRESLHWQRGLVLDDDYNGRALLEHTGNDVRITVRAAYPEAFLSVLTREVKWLVESFWAGLRCDVMVPCVEPCGRNAPGTGLFEVEKLIESKKKRRPEYPCPVCNEWQNIDCLLRNAPAAQPAPIAGLLGSREVLAELNGVRVLLQKQHGEAMGRFSTLDTTTQATLSKVNESYTTLLQMLTDEAKDGPRLFSLVPEDPKFFDLPNWLSQKFRLTLWCEHSRLPLPLFDKDAKKHGEYVFDIKREWLVTVAPYLKLLAGTLSLVVPVASALAKLEINDKAYQAIQKQLELGQKTAESLFKAGEKIGEHFSDDDGPELPIGKPIRAHGAVLRQLHALLKEKDPGFGGLVRVPNKQQEFVWVHPMFEGEY